VTPDRLVERETGETYADKWKRLEGPERGAWLRERGLKIRAAKTAGLYHVVVLDAQGNELIEYRSPEPIASTG
jgi:hypothetical protein